MHSGVLLSLPSSRRLVWLTAAIHSASVKASPNAIRFMLLTDVEGVLDKEGRLMPELSVAEARALIQNQCGTVQCYFDVRPNPTSRSRGNIILVNPTLNNSKEYDVW